MVIWKTITNFPNYEVSSDGRVRSIAGPRAFGKATRLVESTELKRRSNGKYVLVSLWDGAKKKNKYIHRLVAEEFIPNKDNKPEVNHIDGDKQNCDVSNLEWVTRSEQIKHSQNVLGNNKHSRVGRKLNKTEFDLIKNSPLPKSELARQYGVPVIRIIRIKRGDAARWY